MTLFKHTRGKAVGIGRLNVAMGVGGSSRQQVFTRLLNEVAASRVEIVDAENGGQLVVATMRATGDLTALLP